ncbi:flagellar protein export ATPase FliI [Natranaerobius thermophilus]|uniref:Type III secretion system ATPase, FliI/YscN n=1 Tax=Natranaerobius thermophilus (strain ATCC BAA-1301 / DSM 18059 / JW/NM-WN-LF) TaxID=457570 RepID=B2A346_NATTJ|nr:flagellar protein export ATPase FliI [Natranaerobius thermophilus]ACB84977.1 type III secretion system ATPase, FliI/YscN [Natranaerobius thermophilus JW/NM-WN-LF]
MATDGVDLDKLSQTIRNSNTLPLQGEVTRVVGLTVEARGPGAKIGDLCLIRSDDQEIECEVVGFNDGKILLMPLGNLNNVAPGNKVITSRENLSVPVGPGLVGRVLDGLGRPMDGKGPLTNTKCRYPMENTPPAPLDRSRIQKPIQTGIKAIDGVLTIGKGQRMGIFSGSGVGKSTLLGMIARNTSASVNVIGLIGERGREVREFIEKDLGEEGLQRSVIVVATSDQPALLRIKGAMTATAIAEYFRDCGNDVMLMMDSVTRFATAKREVGLATGEPPATRGFPPSVFAMLPQLLERSGTSDKGSVTGLYTVLVDGDDMDEPVSDTVRGVLDGHIVLSRKLAMQNHYPAIDILQSISRVMVDITDTQHQKAAAKISSALAAYEEARDLIEIGAYKKGSNPKVDWAMELIDDLNEFLRQEITEKTTLDETINKLKKFLDD